MYHCTRYIDTLCGPISWIDKNTTDWKVSIFSDTHCIICRCRDIRYYYIGGLALLTKNPRIVKSEMTYSFLNPMCMIFICRAPNMQSLGNISADLFPFASIGWFPIGDHNNNLTWIFLIDRLAALILNIQPIPLCYRDWYECFWYCSSVDVLHASTIRSYARGGSKSWCSE